MATVSLTMYFRLDWLDWAETVRAKAGRLTVWWLLA